MNSPGEEGVSTVTWRPHVQPVGNVPRPGSGLLEPLTKTSLQHNQPPSIPIGTSHNAAPKPFSGPTLVHKQFNSPINLYSNKNIAETIQAHSELLAPGVVGINFMKPDAPVNKESAVYKAILEEEAAKSQPRGGAPFGSHYHQPVLQQIPVQSAPAVQPSAHLAHQHQPREELRTSPTLQSHSFRRLQQVLGDSDEAPPIRHVEAPSARAPVASNQTIEQNVCSECGRLIVGIFCKIKDRKLHEECFRCSTCGGSLKNQGYFNINEKLYCELHAQQAARTETQPSRIVQPNSTTIRPTSVGVHSPTPGSLGYGKPTSPSIPAWQPTESPLSPKIGVPNRVASPINNPVSNTNSSSLTKTYNTNLYQSVPQPYPGPGSESYSKQPTTVSAPKFKWPGTTTTSSTSETINTGDGVAKVRSETVQSSYNSGPIYSGNTISNTYSNTYSNAQQIQQLSNKLDSVVKLADSGSSKVPPRTLPKPQINNWSKPIGTGSGLNQTQTYRQQTTTIGGSAAPLSNLGVSNYTNSTTSTTTSGQSSITGSRAAPRRGRGQLRTFDQGGRQPVCASPICGQAIRGPFIAALNRTWCPDHFVCAHNACRRPLQDCGFVEEKGNLYCENCFELHFAPTCAKCGQRIKGDCLIALDKQYHPQCFVCSYCKKVFANTSFYLEDGLPYCEQDWNELFTTKCIACGLAIEAGDRWVEALNNNYHSQCFRCTVCARNLEGESFYAKGGKPYCKAH